MRIAGLGDRLSSGVCEILTSIVDQIIMLQIVEDFHLITGPMTLLRIETIVDRCSALIFLGQVWVDFQLSGKTPWLYETVQRSIPLRRIVGIHFFLVLRNIYEKEWDSLV